MEKRPLQSKKWIAFFFALIVMAGILITALVLQEFTMSMSLFMSAGIIGIAALSIGYVLSTAALDKFMSNIGSLGGNKNNDMDED